MIRHDIITLIGEDPEAHGIFDTYSPTQHRVFCEVRSVGMNEAYKAMSNGLYPQFVFVLSDVAEYNGEKIILYGATQYRVIRTYVDRQKVELTVEEATFDCPVLTT